MRNYKDSFTPEQLERLEQFYISNDPGRTFPDDVMEVFVELFDKERPEHPAEGFETEEDFNSWLDIQFSEFIHRVLLEMRTGEDLERKLNSRLGVKTNYTEETVEQRIIKNAAVRFNKHTSLSVITDDYYRPKIKDTSLLGQTRLKIDEEGNASIVEDPRKSVGFNNSFNEVLFNAIGTAIRALIEEGVKTEENYFLIPRSDFEDFLGISIRKPPKEVIDFIRKNEEPKTEEDWETWKNVWKHYNFWVELEALTRRDTIRTKEGPATPLSIARYNEVRDGVEFDSPFFKIAYNDLKKNSIKGKLRNDQYSYDLIKASTGTKGSAYQIKNKVTGEILDLINFRLSKRGISTPDAKLPGKKHLNHKNPKLFTIFISYLDLINSCPSLLEKLSPKELEDGSLKEVSPQNKTTLIKRAIFGEIKKTKDGKYTAEAKERKKFNTLIEYEVSKHTDWNKRYVKFNIKADDVSLKNLKYKGLTITHEGKDAEYDQKSELHPPEIESLPELTENKKHT